MCDGMSVTRVVIAGAGFAGLSSALFLARRGHQVTMIERDGAPPDGAPSDDVDSWRHPGVPQGRQTHALLARARRILADEAPDVIAAFLERGIREIPVVVGAGRLEGELMLLSRRLVAEAELRRIVAREPGITMLIGDAVTGLQVSPGGAVPLVTGVHLRSGGRVDADVVVDAGGRRSALPEWFAASGLPIPIEERQECGFFYLTRFYAVRRGCQPPESKMPASMPLDYATVLAMGADNDTFSLTVTLSVDDPFRSALRESDRFDAFVRAVPHSAPWIDAGVPISDVSMMARIENRRRRITSGNGPMVGGIVLLGDAALHTNPTLGRGISMGLMHAQHLAEVVHLAVDDPAGFVESFSAWTDEHLGVWYDSQVAADANTLERLAAGVRGERVTAVDTPATRFAAAAFACAAHNEVVGTAVAKMLHLFAPPHEAFGDPSVAVPITEFLASGPSLDRPPDIPNRKVFESMLSAE